MKGRVKEDSMVLKDELIFKKISYQEKTRVRQRLPAQQVKIFLKRANVFWMLTFNDGRSLTCFTFTFFFLLSFLFFFCFAPVVYGRSQARV